MAVIWICLVLLAAILGFVFVKRARDRREVREHSIDPDTLHELLIPVRKVTVFDVRQPLDLLAHSEMIPGATRIAPKEVLENAALIPKEIDAVIYCTCVSDKTSRAILRKARALEFTRIKYLRGGLDGWKAKGYPVEPYTKSFHLDTAV